ncbi:MAG: TIGR02444 family protein [Chromatocurvus sp.]
MPLLWEGMLDLYAAPGVAGACIAVQDTCDADVLLLLTAALLARSGLRLPPDLAGRMAAETQEWRSEVVRPLRALRRRWRERPAAQALRERVKALELDAERSEVETLQALLDAASPLPRSGPGIELLRANCGALPPGPRHAGADCADALAGFCSSAAAFLWRETAG